MPTVSLNKNEFERLVGKRLPLEKLKERISMLGTDLENIEGNTINVEVFPDRPDMLSEQGFARAFSSFIGIKKGLREYKAKPSSYNVQVDSSVSSVRPYTTCCVVKGLSLSSERLREIIQIQEKLHVTYGRNRKKIAIGIYPLDTISWPVNFAGRKPKDIVFKPLDATKELSADGILSLHPAGLEYGHLLSGLSRYPVFVDSKNSILSMPPIINSEDVGRVSEGTKDIFVECSGFDFDVLSLCLNIIATALIDMGGSVYEVTVHYGKKRIVTPDFAVKKMPVDISYVNRVLGLSLKEKDVKSLLERMGFSYSGGKALIPCYRGDILHQIDIVEDIAIAYGYENFSPLLPSVSTIGGEDAVSLFEQQLGYLLTGFGILEVCSYHLGSKELYTKKVGLSEPVISVGDSFNSEYNVLRNRLLANVLSILSSNKHHEYPHKLFEIGRVFTRSKSSETGILESLHLCVAISHARATYTEVRQILDFIFYSIGLSHNVVDVESNMFISGRAGSVKCEGKNVGIIGEVHPKVLTSFGIEMPTCSFEIDVSEIFSILKR